MQIVRPCPPCGVPASGVFVGNTPSISPSVPPCVNRITAGTNLGHYLLCGAPGDRRTPPRHDKVQLRACVDFNLKSARVEALDLNGTRGHGTPQRETRESGGASVQERGRPQ
ncbi:hypothetical protein SKAU_G00002780 [Synaphobranchus kaupii]|uniref:Uncharacterized protein n=1 Tax=Synaphobranchus kaupii TaxID=118154 RepID=A0A9Q1JC76_SYNKA|nr:hypothetical protein SKAU_G00002780 [Synaphobranchus kaupii]